MVSKNVVWFGTLGSEIAPGFLEQSGLESHTDFHLEMIRIGNHVNASVLCNL